MSIFFNSFNLQLPLIYITFIYMGYAQALEKAWNKISDLIQAKEVQVRFLQDVYLINIEERSIFSQSCNIPPKEYTTILILHYLIKREQLKILPEPKEDWISFKELNGGEGYYPTFKKRTIDVIKRKYGFNPEAIWNSAEQFSAKKAEVGDFGVVIEPFDKTQILIALWRGDDEFGPEVNIHFDSNISKIFPTEDIVVLTEILTHSL